MSNLQLATPQINIQSALPAETLTVSEWTSLLGITDRAFRLRNIAPSGQQYRSTGIVNVFSFGQLPADYRQTLATMRQRHAATSYVDLLDMLRVERRWVPPRSWMDFPAPARERALKRKAALSIYFTAINANQPKGRAEALCADEFDKFFPSKKSTPPRQGSRERNVRNWVRLIEERGGIEFAPDVAYCDLKSCPHVKQRVSHKIRIPEELIAEFADRTARMEHISQAYQSLVLDWKMGREIPGLSRDRQSPDWQQHPFPFKLDHLRPHALGTAARRLGSHGIARAKREALPFVHTSTATLRRCELLLLDDTRVDIIAARDRDGFPVELKAYILMDVASRQILGFIVKEEEALKAEDVWSLLANVLSVAGLPVGYPMRIKFERGAVACSAASESLLRSLWPGRIEVSRTSVNGGRAHAGAWYEAGSGNWMGKAHIESFMRTFAFRLEHIAGQRGGDYRRQPAALGLIGKDRETGRLDYTRGSLLHDGAQTEICDRILRWLESGSVDAPERQLKIDAKNGRHLLPVRWVRDAIQEAVAAYNSNTNHRMQGFARIEYQDPETGALKCRMESPDERAAALDAINPTQAISNADATALLQYRGRAVTITPNGVRFDCSPWKGLRFFHEHSKVIHEVSRLATLQRKYVALFDEEALRNWSGDTSEARPVIHLIGDITNPDAWKPGQPGRYLETLPLEDYAECTDPAALARALGKAKAVESRAKSELIYAARNVHAAELADTAGRVSKVEGAITLLRDSRQIAPSSDLAADLLDRQSPDWPAETQSGPQTRKSQAEAAQDDYLKLLQ